MSNYSDDQDYEDEYPEESTRPVQSTPPRAKNTGDTSRRRRIPDDEIPTRYTRPVLPSEDYEEGEAYEPPPPPSRRVPPPTYADQPQRTPRPKERQKEIYPPARKAQRPKSESGLYLPWWSLLIMLVFVGGIAAGAWVVVYRLGGSAPPGGETPVVVVITATFTVGPPATPTALPQQATLTPTAPLPTIAATLTLPPGQFAIGSTVKVVGVGIAGLNVRSGPGTDSTIRFQARDDELYILKEQPQFASGTEWWFIQAVDDETKQGWAARQYLEVVTNP